MSEPYYLYTRRQGGNYYVQFRLEDGSLSNHNEVNLKEINYKIESIAPLEEKYKSIL